MLPSNTYRKPTPAEQAAFKRWEREVIRGRAVIKRFSAGVNVLIRADEWMLDHNVDHTIVNLRSAIDIIKKWNKIEKIYSTIKSSNLAAVLLNNGDINIIVPNGADDPGIDPFYTDDQGVPPALGFVWFVPVAIVAGLIVIGGAIYKTTELITDAKKEETSLKRRSVEIDREMATKSSSVRAAWEKFKKIAGNAKDIATSSFFGNIAPTAAKLFAGVGVFYLLFKAVERNK